MTQNKEIAVKVSYDRIQFLIAAMASKYYIDEEDIESLQESLCEYTDAEISFHTSNMSPIKDDRVKQACEVYDVIEKYLLTQGLEAA